MKQPPRTLEELLGQVVRRVWVAADNIEVDFKSGLKLRIEPDEDELRFYLDGEPVSQ